MDENNFEKQVRQKMDELKIQPATSVWENIEKRIQKKDPRKKFVWLFAALFIGLTAGGLYLFVQNTPGTNRVAYPQNKIDGSDVSSPAAKNDTRNSGRENEKKPTENLAKNDGNVIKENQDKLKESLEIKAQQDLIVPSKNHPNKKLIETKPSHLPSLPGEGKIVKLAKEKNKNGDRFLENLLQEKELNIERPAKNFEDSSLDIMVEKKTETETVFNSSTKQALKKMPQKWMIGFNFSAGKTLLGAGLLGIGGEKRLADLSYNSPNNSGGPITNPRVYNDPTPRNELAIITGVSAQKKISKNTIIALGINYKYFSTVNEVGSWVGSGNYYSNLSAASSPTFKMHRNDFHFVEVPVSFKMETRQSKKLPVTWQVGAGLSRLVSSNSLQYQQEILFNDNSLFNKTQITLEGGVSAILFSKKLYPISIGPYVNYGINKLANKGLYGNKHLGFIGVRTEILLKNKK